MFNEFENVTGRNEQSFYDKKLGASLHNQEDGLVEVESPTERTLSKSDSKMGWSKFNRSKASQILN